MCDNDHLQQNCSRNELLKAYMLLLIISALPSCLRRLSLQHTALLQCHCSPSHCVHLAEHLLYYLMYYRVLAHAPLSKPRWQPRVAAALEQADLGRRHLVAPAMHT